MTHAKHQPAGESTGEFREGSVETEDFTVRYSANHDQSNQSNAVVILDATTWGLSKVRNALAETYSVTIIELPGFGISATNTKSQSVQELANTTSRAVDQIVDGKFTLIGTSFAANVALWQALLDPEKVEALILISPTALLPLESAAASTPEEHCLQLLAHPSNMRALTALNPARWAKERELAQRLGGQNHDASAEGRLDELRCPTLVVFGVNDKTVAPEAARIYAEKIPNCNISLVYDAGHLIEAERPEALIRAVGDYVEHRETFIVGREDQLINP